MNARDFSERLTQRAARAGITVPDSVIDALYHYVDLLRRWNRKINLTALPLEEASDETLDRLLIEPISVAQKLPNLEGRWYDLGSGGGSPAIPIRLMLVDYSLTMVESRSRKAAFLRECARELKLLRTEVLAARFETLYGDSSLKGTVELITTRAVRVDPDFLALCDWLLNARARLVPFGYSGPPPPGFDVDRSVGFRKQCST